MKKQEPTQTLTTTTTPQTPTTDRGRTTGRDSCSGKTERQEGKLWAREEDDEVYANSPKFATLNIVVLLLLFFAGA